MASTRIRPAFTHLEVHSHFTLLGATASVEALATRAAAEGMTHLSLTDSNALYGAVSFAGACRAKGIQPILGMTLGIAAPLEEVGTGFSHRRGHLVLLAQGPAGYRSLCRLSSLIQSKPDRQASAARGLGWAELRDHTEGLFCLSGGRQGWLERYVRAGNLPAASRYAGRLGGLFGQNACLSLEIHRPEDEVVAQEIIAIGQRFGLPVVATQPVYYLEPDEAPRLRLLAAIADNRRLADISKEGPPGHWLSPELVAERFAFLPQAMDQAAEIAARCQPALPDGRPIWPALQVPGIESAGQTTDHLLETQAQAGLSERYGPEPPAEVRKRLQVELAAIERSGYAPLFLIVADIVRYARQSEIPVSTRGSVANSLVAYCLGVTTVDPIAHDLLFERFLNPARQNPPDIDLDFCSRRRDEVLAYIRRTYGQDRVALVATVSTLQPKSALRETAKAYNLDEGQISRLAAMAPRDWHPDPRRRSRRTLFDLADELGDPQLRAIVREAAQLVGQPHHLSIHPGGVVITPGSLTDFIPVQWAPKGFLTSQFDHRDLEILGLPKLDLLGIRALTVLADTAETIRAQHDPVFELTAIPLDDARTGELLARGETIGVFQCESAGAQRTLRQLQVRTVADLAVANAFFKPGPATGGMAQTFIRRYRGEEPVDFLHPALVPILASTKGVLLFQEQILRVATEIAGLSWEQADHLRRGMSKFKSQEMAALQTQFVEGCCRSEPDGPGFTSDQAQTLWEQVLAFAGYGFNRGHATAYADVSYRSAYLKAHWPAPFLCARLADWGGFHHPAIYMAEAARLGIPVRPPHVNYSNHAFTLTYDAGDSQGSPELWMGLGQVRDLRRDSIQAIVNERVGHPFANLPDLLERVSLQSKEIVHLIQCGALDGLGSNRAAMLADAKMIIRAGSARQMTFAFALTKSRPETAAQRLAWERRFLGQPVSVHPLELVSDLLSGITPLRELGGRTSRRLTIAGARLPGWTGGSGFFLGDGQTFVVVKADRSITTPAVWQPVKIRGRWLSDEWGSAWFQADNIQPLRQGEAGNS